MGFISRKIFPACGRMCVCCPALRSRSRQPVKRYKKLVADIFPKSADGELNERKIVKLCEYAAKNPIRIPKITTYLEERFHKELRHGQLKVINVVTEAYNKLLCMCGKQMAYFASSVLNVIAELLDDSKQPAMQIAGCQVLTRFIYSQIDGTYSHNIESFIQKVCVLAHDAGVEHSKCLLRASSLQCVSAILWFMTQFSHIFDVLDEIVQAALDNYEPDVKTERAEVGHQRVWVDEVVRCEARVGDASPGCISVRPPPVKKNPHILTRVETETPKVWAQICIQRMAELANESTTLRQILEPMFVYFDNGGHWVSQHGLAVMVLSDICYFMENSASENRQLLLAAVIRHLDQKSIVHDPLIKSYVIQVATYLARQIRAGAITVDVGYVGDLCRHLRKSLQATAGPLREEETSFNFQLQNSIEACLLEIAKGMSDTRSFYDLMTITMEKLPPVGAVARAVIGSLIILAHVSSLASASSQSHQVFPEALLVQLLKAMLHTDTETRIGAHRLFSILLFPNAHHIKQEANSRKTGYCYDPRLQASNISKFSSVNTLLEKLRKEKSDVKAEKQSHNTIRDCKGTEFAEEEEKQTGALKNSPNPYCLTSLFDRTAGPTDVADMEPSLTKLSEDQILQLLSGFWIQANLPDNLPSNFEAICHSYSLTLILAHPKNSGHGLVVRFFQLALSLRNISLDPNCGMLPLSCRRMLLVTSTAMLMFAAKTYHINELVNLLKSLVPDDVDPYLGINEDLQAFVRPQANLSSCGMSLDNQMAASVLCGLRDKNYGSENSVLGILARHLCCINKQNEDELLGQLLEVFSPDDALMFAPHSVRNLEHIQTTYHSRGRPSVDDFQDLSATSTADDEGMSASSVANNNHLPAKVPGSPSMSQIISIGQLLESALEVAGQVAGTSVSTSPLPYSVMASQCESLGTGTRKKLSNWLAHENIQAQSDGKLMKDLPPSEDVSSVVPSLTELIQGSAPVKDPSWTLRLPPASPFDNFLRYVGPPNMDVGQVAI